MKREMQRTVLRRKLSVLHKRREGEGYG
jgi:hypothetical protein